MRESDIGIPNGCIYKNRGLLEVFEYYDPLIGWYSENFIYNLAKKLTDTMKNMLGWSTSELKRRIDVTISQNLAYKINDCIYLYVIVYYSDLSTVIWVKGECINTDGFKSQTTPHAESTNIEWTFSVLERLEDDVEAEIRKSDKPVYYEDWCSKLKCFYEKSENNVNISYEYEIECGWPDVTLCVEFAEKTNENIYNKVIKTISDFLQNWKTEHNNEFVHEISFEKQNSKKNQIVAHIDFGSIDPVILEHLLMFLNKIEFEIKKVSFK